MHAIILAGGRGSRLLPYTRSRPKPLMTLGRYSILEILLRRLRSCGFDRATLCIAHLGDMIRDEFGDGARLGLAIDYCIDEPPCGTAAPLRQVPDWDTPAVVMNADILTAVDFAHLHGIHVRSGCLLSVAVRRREVPMDLGVLHVAAGQVRAIWEKPTLAVDVSSGMYVIDPVVRELIPAGSTVDMPDLIESLIGSGEDVYAYRFADAWHDIGTPAGYLAAEREFLADPEHYLTVADRPRDGHPVLEAR